jgi:hypothetical protein
MTSFFNFGIKQIDLIRQKACTVFLSRWLVAEPLSGYGGASPIVEQRMESLREGLTVRIATG